MRALIGGWIALLLACSGETPIPEVPATKAEFLPLDPPKGDRGPVDPTPTGITPWKVTVDVAFDDYGLEAMQKVADLHKAQLGVCGPESGVPGEVKVAVALQEGAINGTIVRKHAPKQEKTAECVSNKLRKWVYPTGMSGDAVFTVHFTEP